MRGVPIAGRKFDAAYGSSFLWGLFFLRRCKPTACVFYRINVHSFTYIINSIYYYNSHIPQFHPGVQIVTWKLHIGTNGLTALS